MTTEKDLREILNSYAIGLELHEYKNNDKVVVYPTRYQGIHRMELTLRGHLNTISLKELLKHLLSKKDFEEWVFLSTPIKATGSLSREQETKKQYRETHHEEISAKGKLYYLKNKERICKRNREYLQKMMLENPEKVRAQKRKWKKLHPQQTRTFLQYKAQYLAQQYIKVDKCEVCGSTVNLHRHHPDYMKPLEVQILCAHCHIIKHQNLPGEGIRND
jgi:hypothetical protein